RSARPWAPRHARQWAEAQGRRPTAAEVFAWGKELAGEKRALGRDKDSFGSGRQNVKGAGRTWSVSDGVWVPTPPLTLQVRHHWILMELPTKLFVFVTLHFGSAFWSSVTPASVTFSPSTFRLVRFFRTVSSLMPASVVLRNRRLSEVRFFRTVSSLM